MPASTFHCSQVLTDWIQSTLDAAAEAAAGSKKSHSIDYGSMKMFGSLVLLEETLQSIWAEQVRTPARPGLKACFVAVRWLFL